MARSSGGRLRGVQAVREVVDLRLLGVALALLAAVWAILGLAAAAGQGEPHELDAWALRACRSAGDPAQPRGPAWLPEAARDLTALGGLAVLGSLLAALIGLLLLLHKPHMALLVLAAGGGAIVLSNVMKLAFERPRPSVVPPLVVVQSPSFPSGHATVSAAVYLALGVLVARLLRLRAARVYVIAVAGTLTLIVGLTRVYLGVHYPSDVLAGWLAGASWALLCGSVAVTLQRRGAVEPPGAEPGGH